MLGPVHRLTNAEAMLVEDTEIVSGAGGGEAPAGAPAEIGFFGVTY
jgi:hypothetical protein